MRDFCAGNRSTGKYAEKTWRDEEWNPYVGEEEPIGGCCVREYGASVTGSRGGSSMEMPELSEKEQDDIKVWNGRIPEPPGPAVRWSGRTEEEAGPAAGRGGQKPVPAIPVPKRGSQPPRRPEPGPKPLPEWGSQPPRRPKPGRKESIPVPEWEKQSL